MVKYLQVHVIQLIYIVLQRRTGNENRSHRGQGSGKPFQCFYNHSPSYVCKTNIGNIKVF